MKAFFINIGLFFAFYLLTLCEELVFMNCKLMFFLFLSGSFFLLSLNSCKKNNDVGDDPADFPTIYRGEIEANRYLLTFIAMDDTMNKQVVEFYDPDGIGGAAPTIQQILLLKNASDIDTTYKSVINLFQDNKEVTDEIIGKSTEYIICYREYDENNLRPGESNKDKNGVNLGTEVEWSTDSSGILNNGLGNIKVTLNFQPNGKNGLCDPGIRILEGSIPYQLN